MFVKKIFINYKYFGDSDVINASKVEPQTFVEPSDEQIKTQFAKDLQIRCCRKFVKPSNEFDIYLGGAILLR